MSKPKMFRKGEKYETFDEFLYDYRDVKGSRYVYYHHKLMHVNFVAAMHLSSVINTIDRGILFRAIKNSEGENK